MRLLKKIGDPVTSQILCDALRGRGIRFQVDNAGMNLLLPVPGLMDTRIMVDDEDLIAAERVLSDLNLDRD